MKKLITILVTMLLLAGTAMAGQACLQWPPATSTPDLWGYRVYSRTETGSYNFDDPAWEGTETTCQIPLLEEGTFYFVARIVDSEGYEGPNSNEVSYYNDDTYTHVAPIETIQLQVIECDTLSP